jgi:hypothetical protein
MSQPAQLSLFETELRKKTGHMPNNYYRALEEDVLQEALEIFRQHADRFHSGSLLLKLSEKHNLGGYWTRTIRELVSRGFLDEFDCYWGSDTPSDKSREYMGYHTYYRIKKEHRNDN